THRAEATDADALRAEQYVFALLPIGEAVEAEGLAPQREWLQVAQGQGVFVVARHRLAALRVAGTLGVEGADTALPTEIGVDESTADAAAMVEAQLRLGQPCAGGVDAVAENEVV